MLYLSFQMAVGKTKYSDSNSIISFGILIKFHCPENSENWLATVVHTLVSWFVI
jgi:hypothetical protein